jgi:galactose-1-phosphate uridylyltransferase
LLRASKIESELKGSFEYVHENKAALKCEYVNESKGELEFRYVYEGNKSH